MTNRNDWRAWLQNNNQVTDEVWLIYYKKHTGKPTISYEVSVEEAVCFGWVDSIIKRLDGDRCARKFTPRKDASTWSESNKKRAEKMIREGKMTEIGLAKIRRAKESGEWTTVREVNKKLVIPSFIQNALRKDEKACAFFEALATSQKKRIVGWVSSAKREETRSRRMAEVIGLLEKNQKLGLK